MANKRVSEMEMGQVGMDSLIPFSIPDSNNESGYGSRKDSAASIADKILNTFEFSTRLNTDNKTIFGAINEAVQSGGFHTYSTDEQVVGTWIDGSPVYERTFVVDITQGIGDNWALFDDSVSYGLLIDYTAMRLISDESFYYVPNIDDDRILYFKINTSNHQLQYALKSNRDFTGYATFRYTKTTQGE